MAAHNILDDASSVGSGGSFSSKSQLPPSGDKPSRSRSASSSSASRWAWVPLAGLVAAALALGGPVLAAESPVIRAGSELDFRPYGFTDKDGQPTGFGPELLRSVADKMGLRLQRTVGPWNTVWNDLVAGKLDVLPVVARTPGREPLVDFSLPHTETFDAFFMRPGQPVIANLAAASGKEIVVLREDAAHHQLLERKFAGKIIAVGSIPEGLRLVAAGKHDAFLCSKVIGLLELKAARIAGVAAGPPIPDYKRTFCFGVRKGQAELVEKLNQGLLIVKSDGTYDRLYRQWLNTYEPRYPYLPWLRGAAALAGGLAIAVLVLQGLVRRRTRELRELNATLEAHVTERTAALRETNERLTRVLAVEAVGVMFWDLTTGCLVDANDTFLRLMGYSRSDLEARDLTWQKFTPPEYHEISRAEIEKFQRTGRVGPYEKEYFRKDGTRRWLLFSGSSLGGNMCVEFCVDIADRKKAEAELIEQQRLHKSVTDNAALALFIMDDRQHCVFMNPAAVQLTGYTLEETQGRPLHDLVHHTRPDGRPFPLSECAIDRAFPENDREQGEEVFVHKDGHFYPVAFTASPLRDASGQPVGTIIEVQDITERKRAEEKLRASEGRMQQALRVGHSFTFEWQPATDRVLRSASCGEILGLSGDDVVNDSGQRYFQRIHPDDRARFERMVQALTPAANTYTTNYRLVRGDGRLAVLEETGAANFDATGQLERLVGVTADITERKQAEEAVKKSEEKFRLLFDTMTEGFGLHEIILGPDGEPCDWRFLELNAAWEKQTGMARGEVLGKTMRQVWPDLDACWVENFGKVALSGEPFRSEGYNPHLKGWYEVLAYRTKLNQFAVLFADITARKQAEEALRESEENYRTLFTSIDEGFCVIEMLFDEQGKPNDWRYLQVNPAFERHNGLVQAIGKRIRELTPGVEAKWFEIYGKVALTGHAIRFEESSEAFNRWFDLYAFRVGQPDEHKVAVLFTDITARKQAEAALAQHREELERLVAERTAKLQELVGELEHFSYTITHDLKAPLRAMRGFAEVAGQVCGESEAKPFLDKISTAAERMDSLIADALSYSRSVRQQLPLGDVDAGALLRGILDSYPQFQPWKAQIRVKEPLPVVLANEAGLTQVFSNLLGNAVKFVKPGGKPEIRVWSREVMGHGRDPEWVRIWVEDKGIGIAKEMLPRVFEMFSRGSKDYEGTGIGLALVRKVVQRMGGKVGVESEEGKGSRFWIELGRGEARVALSQGTGQQPTSAGEGMVLYVEDEESDAEFMNRAFTEKGLGEKLRRVGTGRAAIEYLSGANEFADREKYPVPTVVLLDLNLPQVSGFGVLEWIRNNPDHARLPVVVLSSSTRQDDRVRARELGADEFLAKPSSGLEFGRVVENLLEKWLGRSGGELGVES